MGNGAHASCRQDGFDLDARQTSSSAGTVRITMFEYFPGNRRWSTAVNVALMAGATLGELHPWIEPLRTGTEEPSAWRAAWTDAGLHQEHLAERDDANGFALSASRRSLRAVVYHTISEWYAPPGPDKAECYSAALQAFAKARDYGSLPIERVDAPVAGGSVPGYLSNASITNSRYRPVVICAGGPDIPKELAYCIVGDAFARAELDVLVVDFPGSGEALRLGGMPARPDSETAVAALVDHLRERDRREVAVGVLGVGAGGHHAIRAAALEPRISACATWGAIITMNGGRPDCAIETAPDGAMSTNPAGDVESALERCQEWSLDDILPSLIQPLLVLHGASDAAVPIDEVLGMVDAAPSLDKTLWLFEERDGGTERFQADQPDAARDMLSGWFADRLARAIGESSPGEIVRAR
jgi:pimeloyl-ACP methyl ester carboxylesterase